nr:AAA family ATPase [uncultured Albidiferax sp.]
MKLSAIEYSELENTPQAWILEKCSFGKKTLLVGKNASGKSRTLRVICSLANQLSGLQPPSMSGTYNCTFHDELKEYSYHCMFKDGEVIAEVLRVDSKIYLERGQGGVGKIWAEKIDNGKHMDFQTPPSEFAAVARRDSIQHPFLEPLYQWASTLRYFQFGSNIGKDHFAHFVANGINIDERNQASVVALFRNARRDYPNNFVSDLIQDMRSLDYELESIDMGSPISILNSPEMSQVVGLIVKEKDLQGFTDQLSMSQGMYRVLSLLINVNYFQVKNSGSCIIIDDIGEGLDFDRSCKLISLLREKSEKFQLQIIISTNDRFVMNEVPLEEWSIIQRKGSRVSFKNIENSREIFENFKFTGLSNFSFLELDVLNEPLGEGASPDA